MGVKILVTMNGKGGVGKTTTSINLAAILSDEYKTLLVDADPQASATWWVNRGEMPFEVSQGPPKLLRSLFHDMGYELVVIDTPPALNFENLAAVVQAADYLILPTLPSPMDLQALLETVKVAIASTNVPYRVLLTKVDPRSINDAFDAQKSLIDVGIPVFNTFIRAYKVHQLSPMEGVPITQARGSNAREAASDYRRVAGNLMREWGVR